MGRTRRMERMGRMRRRRSRGSEGCLGGLAWDSFVLRLYCTGDGIRHGNRRVLVYGVMALVWEDYAIELGFS